MNLSENTYGDQHSPTESQAPQLDPVAELNDFFAHGQESTEFKGDKEKLVEASVVDAEQGSLNIAENIVEEKVMNLNDFIFALSIDNINLFEVEEFIEKSELAKKVYSLNWKLIF